ncbi:isoprenylcysteine carboxylmethyltransferase family protein [Acidobacteria bacterium AB60]|nr:isoprenylcysteine carboxylmethyltransferase family protein [Acidobacteria bacterium AB60]
MKLNYGTLVLGLVLIAWIVYMGERNTGFVWPPHRIAGVAIALVSFLLLVVARVQLGRAFSIQAKASMLVTSGLYARIRNPIYVFGSLMIAGLIIWTGKPWLFVLLGLLIVMQVRRARTESRVLEEKFGDAYRAYKKRTWF